MKHHSFLLLCLVMLASIPEKVTGSSPKSPDIVLGYIHERFAFAVSQGTYEEESYGNKVEIQKLTLADIHGLKGASVKKYHYYEVIGQNLLPYRWRIADDCYWGSGSVVDKGAGAGMWRIPLDDLGLFDKSNKEREKEFKRKYPAGKWERHLQRPEYRMHGWFLEPVADEVEAYLDELDRHTGELGSGGPGVYGLASGRLWSGLGNPGVHVQGIYFDFLPVTEKKVGFFAAEKNKVELFILRNKVMSIWEGRGQLKEKGTARDAKGAESKAAEELRQRPWAGWNVKWSRRAVEQFAVDFTEPFVVYGSYARYFFVTQSGKLYVASKDPKWPRRARHVAEAPAIQALITDTGTGRTFAFASTITVVPPARGKAEPVYFEPAEEIRLHSFDPKSIKPVKAPEPLKTVLEYCQVLLNDGRLKKKTDSDGAR